MGTEARIFAPRRTLASAAGPDPGRRIQTDERAAQEALPPDLDFFSAAPGLDSDAEPTPNDAGSDKDGSESEDASESESPADPGPREAPPCLATPEAIATFRKQHRIRVYGTDVPAPIQSWQDLCVSHGLKRFLAQNLAKSEYKAPTPIQMQGIPIMLQNRDILACAPTGSGKTLAFLLPILQAMDRPSRDGFRALILSPTRELAQQIHRETLQLCTNKPFRAALLTSLNTQSPKALAQVAGYDILISTPARLQHALARQLVSLERLEHFVLDEADKLLEEPAFIKVVDEALSAAKPTCAKYLFSATIPSGVEELAKSVMSTDPIRVVIGEKNAATSVITQSLLFTSTEEGKLLALRQHFQAGLRPPVLIFVQSIERATQLFHELLPFNVKVDVIHSDKSKADRTATVNAFREGKVWVLVCTELLARGLDFKGVAKVINFDLPTSAQSYIHRIGRTGRAGRPGEALTLFTRDDLPYLPPIVNVMKASGQPVPEWMNRIPKLSKLLKKRIKTRALERKDVDSRSAWEKKKLAKKKSWIQGSVTRK